MPVQFRCDRCRGKLSISRRKAGTQVACPKCGHLLTVPTGKAVADDLTEMLTAVRAGARPAKAAAGGSNLPAPAAPPPVPTLDDMPLFERSDFERLLDPSVRAPEPLPLPPPPTDDGIPDRSRTAVAAHTPDVLVLTRTTATLLVVAVVVLLGLAFVAGFLVAG
jgi:ribosomal protein S27E